MHILAVVLCAFVYIILLIFFKTLTDSKPQAQSTCIYLEYHSVCPLVGIGTLPTHLSPASVPLSQEAGAHTRLRVRGWGSPNSDDWRKSLALCLLCAAHSQVLSSLAVIKGLSIMCFAHL
jgi:hypothetical protein